MFEINAKKWILDGVNDPIDINNVNIKNRVAPDKNKAW